MPDPVDLIVQGLEVETRDLKEIARLSGASSIEKVASNAFRLHDPRTKEGVAERCAQSQLDYAFVPSDRKLSDFRLLVMDMDSTLITIETVDELADLVGRKEEVAAITDLAMRGEIEYDESLRKRVAVLKGLDESALARLYDERLRLSPGAEKLIAGVKRAGLKVLLVSGGFTHITERLRVRLGLDYTKSNTLKVVNGKLTGEIEGHIVNAGVKRESLLAISDELRIRKDQIIAIGDGANDLRFMGEAGVSIAYHAKPVVRQKATHCLNHVGLDGTLNMFR
jgi:phosphoserine phosphatase